MARLTDCDTKQGHGEVKMENTLSVGVGSTLIAYWADEYERLFGPSGTADKMKSADQIPPDEMKKYVDNYNKWFDAAPDADGTKTKLDVLRRLRDWLQINLDTLDKLIKYMESTFALLVVMAVAGCQSGKYEIDTDVSSANEKLTYRIVEKLNPEAYSEEYLPVEVSVKKSSGSDNSGGLCFLTIGIIPAFYDDFETIVVTVKTPIGTKTGSGSLHAKKWIGWICLIPYPGSAESRSDNPRLPNSTLEEKVKNQIVESLVSQFPKEEYVALLSKIKQAKIAEQQRAEKKKQMLEGLINDGKFEEVIKECELESVGSGKENPWTDILERAVAVLKKSIPSMNDAKRLVSLFSKVEDVSVRDAIVIRLGTIGKCADLGEETLAKYVRSTALDEGRLCAVAAISDADELAAIAKRKYSKAITIAVFKKLNTDKVRPIVFATDSVDEELAAWYIEFYGTDKELVDVINQFGDKLGRGTKNAIRDKSSSDLVRDELNKMEVNQHALSFEESMVKHYLFDKCVHRIEEEIQDAHGRAALAECLMEKHMKYHDGNIYIGFVDEDGLAKFAGMLSSGFCEKLFAKDFRIYGGKNEWFAILLFNKMGEKAKQDRIRLAFERLNSKERIQFCGYYIGMPWVDFAVMCAKSGQIPHIVSSGSRWVDRIKFGRTERYALFAKEDGEFWSAFMRQYIPAGKKKSLGETISDTLDSGTYSYQNGYDDKLEEHCYIYKSIKYGTKVLFGEESGTLVLEPY